MAPLPDKRAHVTGAVLGRRKAQTKIAVWTRDRNETQALEDLKVKLITTLQVCPPPPALSRPLPPLLTSYTLTQLKDPSSIKYEPHQ